MRHWTLGLPLLGIVLGAAGCLHLNPIAPFQYAPAPIPDKGSIPVSVGFHRLLDERPPGDRVQTRCIEDLPEKVTDKLVADLRVLHIFQAVHFPATAQDDVIITGTVTRFSWRAYENPLDYIPLVNLFRTTGIPLGLSSGVVDLQLTLSDGNTGASLGAVRAASHAHSFFNVYDLGPEWPGTELGESFQAAEAQLAEQMVSRFRQGQLPLRHEPRSPRENARRPALLTHRGPPHQRSLPAAGPPSGRKPRKRGNKSLISKT